VQVLVQRWGYGALILGRIDDDHDFVLTHGPHHLLWSSVSAMLIWAWQEGRCVSNLASVPRCLRKWEIRDHSPPLLPSRPRPARLGPGYLLTAAHPTARVTGIIVMKIIAMENSTMMTFLGFCAWKL